MAADDYQIGADRQREDRARGIGVDPRVYEEANPTHDLERLELFLDL